MTPSDSTARPPAEFQLPALYPRSPPREPVDRAGPQAFPLCSLPACCHLHPGSLDGFASPTPPPPIPAFARRPEARRLHSQLSQLCPLGLRGRGSSVIYWCCGLQVCLRPLAAYDPTSRWSLRGRYVGPARRDQLPGHARTQTTRVRRGLPEAGSFHPARTEVSASQGRRPSARTPRTCTAQPGWPPCPTTWSGLPSRPSPL